MYTLKNISDYSQIDIYLPPLHSVKQLEDLYDYLNFDRV